MRKVIIISILTALMLIGCDGESKTIGGYDGSHNDFINQYSEDTHIIYAFRVEDGQFVGYSDGSEKANAQMNWSKKSFYNQKNYKPDYKE